MSDENEKLTKTLLDNWVEERQCQTLGLEKDKHNPDGTLCTKLHRRGHKGILTTCSDVPVEGISTVKSSYVPPVKCPVATTGKRAQLLTEQVYRAVVDDMNSEMESAEEIRNTFPTTSVTKEDYHRDFTPVYNESDTVHTLEGQPTTYWTNNIENVTGVSQVVPTTDSPFKKNATFSTPIEQQMDQQMA